MPRKNKRAEQKKAAREASTGQTLADSVPTVLYETAYQPFELSSKVRHAVSSHVQALEQPTFIESAVQRQSAEL